MEDSGDVVGFLALSTTQDETTDRGLEILWENAQRKEIVLVEFSAALDGLFDAPSFIVFGQGAVWLN